MKSLTIARLIRHHRTQKKLTQKELAFKLGVHPQLISNIERGVMSFPLKHSRAMCDALGIKNKQWRGLVIRNYEEKLDHAI